MGNYFMGKLLTADPSHVKVHFVLLLKGGILINGSTTEDKYEFSV